MITGKSSIFLATLLILLLNVTSGYGKDWYLDGNSDSDDSICGTSLSSACKTLKVLIAKVNAGDTIHVAVGIYTGPDNIDITVSVANIQIVGTDANNCIFDLGGSSTFLTITVPGVVVAKVTVRNGVTANVNLGAITVKLTVGATVNGLLSTLRFQNVNFLNIQGTALLLADVSVLDGAVQIKANVNAGIIVQVILSSCTFVNISVNPALHVVGRISVRLNSVSFTNCGAESDSDLAGVAVKAELGCILILANVNIQNCNGASLLDLSNLAASLSVSGILSLKANVVTQSLLNLNVNLKLTVLGLSLSLNLNSNPAICTTVPCGLVNLGLLCSDYTKECPIVGLDYFDSLY